MTSGTFDSSRSDAHHQGLVKAFTSGIIALVAVSILGMVAAYFIADLKGLYGAAIGFAMGGAFVLLTIVIMVMTKTVKPTTSAAIMMGSWLVKIVIALVITRVLQPLDFYSKPALGCALIVALVIVLSVQTRVILRNNAPYVGS